ncbi:MAG: DNA translocase FtsK, partial [Oscillospiraceae bacterium]
KNSGGGFEQEDGDDPLFEQAIEVVVEAGQASTSLLQRRLKLGYARAARIMDDMESMGIIGPSEGSKPRNVLISKQQFLERKLSKKDNTN